MFGRRPVPILLALSLLLTTGCSTATKQRENNGEKSATAGIFSTVANAPTPTPQPPTFEELQEKMSYIDVPQDASYRGAVEYMTYLGVMQGTGGGAFTPGQTLNRATAVTTFFRLSGDKEVPYTDAFSDVSPDDWFAQGVAWAVNNGIVQGYEDGTFRPYEELDRAQLAVLLQRYAQAYGGYNGVCGSMEQYWDADQVPEYAQEAMSWATVNGIYTPLVSAELGPRCPVTRAQLAQALTAVHYGCTYDPLAGLIVTQQNDMAQSKAQASHALLQASVEEAAKKYGSMGVQVAVIENGRVTDAFATGWANRYQLVTLDKDTGKQLEVDAGQMTIHHKIRIASISKVVIGMAAMALQERGVIDLDASIGDYWGFSVKNPHSSAPVSVRSLLTHTSSIVSYGDNESRLYNQVKKRLSSSGAFRNMTPGNLSGWGYNNYAFGVLGMTLELADHRVMDDITGEYFFDPLNIDAAFESGELKNTGLLAVLYSHGGGINRSVQTQKGLKLKGGPGATGQFFAGGLTISAPDLAKLIAALANDGVYEGQRLLSEASVQTMETSIGMPWDNPFEQCQPLRLQKNIYGRSQLYYHTGSAYGVYNCFSYDPVSKDGVVVLTTGSRYKKDDHGIYAVCGEIMTQVYAVTKD